MGLMVANRAPAVWQLWFGLWIGFYHEGGSIEGFVQESLEGLML